jgi:hypothetical protein
LRPNQEKVRSTNDPARPDDKANHGVAALDELQAKRHLWQRSFNRRQGCSHTFGDRS